MSVSLQQNGIFPDRSRNFHWTLLMAVKEIEGSEKNKSQYTEVPLRILFADDDEDDRELFREAIANTEFNAKLEVALDGKDLLEKLNEASKKPDIIVLDLNMPYKSGAECLKILRDCAEFKHIPIVIYSTSSSEQDIEETYNAGANLYISKPTSFNDLIRIVRDLLTIDWGKYQPKSSKKKYFFKPKHHGYG